MNMDVPRRRRFWLEHLAEWIFVMTAVFTGVLGAFLLAWQMAKAWIVTHF